MQGVTPLLPSVPLWRGAYLITGANFPFTFATWLWSLFCVFPGYCNEQTESTWATVR